MSVDCLYVRKYPEGYKIGYIPEYATDLDAAFKNAKVYKRKKAAMNAAERLMQKYRWGLMPVNGGVVYLGKKELEIKK